LGLNKYNLITQKQADYLLFKKIVNLIEQGEHLKWEGLQSIINVRASLNLGLSEVLKAAFPNTISVVRPNISSSEIPHSEWMAGFITGEGCFFIKITKGRNKAGVGVSLSFQVSQHIRDEVLLKSFVTYFKCGHYVKPFQKEWGYFRCAKFSDNYNIIKPFFTQYSIRGAKAKDLVDWVEASEIINKGDHLTTEGSSKIMSIKAGMNTGRSL
jgi:LAGLIDADG endonuclease